MSVNTLLEVFAHILFNFTRNVTKHYNPEEPEYTAESITYDPLLSTGREWYHLPADELIYQEYSDRESTASYFAFSSVKVKIMDACSLLQSDDEPEDERNRAMAWKRLRPSLLHTICKSMYIGAWISLLSITVLGVIYTVICYIIYKTVMNCQYQNDKMAVEVQWARTLADIVSCAFYYTTLSVLNPLLLFQPHQLKGVKIKLILFPLLMYILDALYRALLQALKKPIYMLPRSYDYPVYVLFFITFCFQLFLIGKHLCIHSRSKLAWLIFKMATPIVCTITAAVFIGNYVYMVYNKQNERGKLVIALLSPLIGVVLKAISRICVQRLWNITHPGYSYVLLAPLYCLLAVMFRVLQADLSSLGSIAILGIIHGFAEVVERSIVVVIDHICHQICSRRSNPWGSFRTPRRERLTADIAIMSMLYESTAIVSVNSFMYLYQFIFLENAPLFKILQSFAIHTSVPLVIEWFFTSMSLAIETRYQNMAVMAVWRKQWKRHTLVAVVNVVPVAVWTSVNLLLTVVHGRFNEAIHQTCKMPFT